MVFRKHKQKPGDERRIAQERIEKLFFEADAAFRENPKLSNRYVELARKIAMKYKVRIPSMLKRRFCSHCHSYLKQGLNCKARLHDKRLVYQCLECSKFMRFPYKR